MALLLIGSTGNGKSTLGNFLVDPNESHVFAEKTKFRMARSNMPETQDVTYGDFRCGDRTFRVIDTPGLNESPAKDLFHMTSLIMALNDPNLQGVSACLLCVKFNSKIDDQYIATVKYYSRLLPSLFEGNVLIIMTEFMTDDRTEKLRKIRQVDVERVMMDTANKIKETAELAYTPPLFAIDCLPMDKEERKCSLRVRSALLDYIQLLTPVNTTSLQVEKTKYLSELDDKKVHEILGEIGGYNEKLKEANQAATDVLTKIEEHQREILEINGNIANTVSELAVKDSTDLVVANSWSLSKQSKTLVSLDEKFDIPSKWKIDEVRMWTNVSSEIADWKNVQQSDYSVSGSLQGHYMGRLHASVTLHTKIQRKYATEIDRKNKELAELNQELTEMREQLQECYKQHEKYKKDIELLETYIDQRKNEIGKLRLCRMNTNEAMKRVDELRQLVVLQIS